MARKLTPEEEAAYSDLAQAAQRLKEAKRLGDEANKKKRSPKTRKAAVEVAGEEPQVATLATPVAPQRTVNFATLRNYQSFENLVNEAMSAGKYHSAQFPDYAGFVGASFKMNTAISEIAMNMRLNIQVVRQVAIAGLMEIFNAAKNGTL